MTENIFGIRRANCCLVVCLAFSACVWTAGCGARSSAEARAGDRATIARTDATTGATAEASVGAASADAATGKTAAKGARAAGWNDADADGIPDRAEIHSFDDRENFRRWFTAIAELQFYEVSKEWNAEQRDCAGLVRFAWRESLRRHDRVWLRRMGAAYEPFAPDVRAYNLDTSPTGEKLFRTRFGAFKESDLNDATLSEFADARTLKDFNAIFVSRDRRQAQPGDLLFFFRPWAREYPHHVMIFLGEAREASGGATDWVVYHTGASAHDAGTVRKVRLSVLDRHPDAHWRPLVNNRHFLGFYRLKILQ